MAVVSADIFDGKALGRRLEEGLSDRVSALGERGVTPHLAVVIAGDDHASHVYVRNKQRACEKTGIASTLHRLDTETTSEQLLQLIAELNLDPEIHGILCQLPLPDQIDEAKVIAAIDPEKDVDGFHPFNVGRLAQRMPLLRPCTPAGVVDLLDGTGQDITGMHAVIVGASNIVGRPMGLELLLKGCTVTTCHRFTKDLEGFVNQADIVVVAVGKPGIVKGEWVKEGAIVIDVGINRLDSGKLVGDVDFDAAAERASHITPVPGGVGPMTRAKLLENTLFACEELHDQ